MLQCCNFPETAQAITLKVARKRKPKIAATKYVKKSHILTEGSSSNWLLFSSFFPFFCVVSAGHFANSFSLRVKLIRNQQNEQKTKKRQAQTVPYINLVRQSPKSTVQQEQKRTTQGASEGGKYKKIQIIREKHFSLLAMDNEEENPVALHPLHPLNNNENE